MNRNDLREGGGSI